MEENKKEIWFKAKTYGYGWYPCTWQGWGVLIMYVFALLSVFLFVDINSHSASDAIMNFFPAEYILTVFLIIICDAKGEKAKWRWGKKE